MNTPFPGYTVPHDTLTQNLDSTVTPVINRMNPVLVGTQYLLSVNDGRELSGAAFAASGTPTSIAYAYRSGNSDVSVNLTTHTVDLASVKLIAEGLEAEVASGIEAIADGSNYSIRFTDVIFSSSGENLTPDLGGRPIYPGDILYAKDLNDPDVILGRATVTGYLPQKLVPVVGDPVTPVGYPLTSVTGTYEATTDNQFIFSIVSANSTSAQYALYDTAGKYPKQTGTWTYAAGLTALLGTSGLSLVIAAAAGGESSFEAVAGQSVTTLVNGAGYSSTDFDGVTVDTPPFPSDFAGGFFATVVQLVSGELTQSANTSGGTGSLATISAGGVTYDADNLGITHEGTGDFVPFYYGKGRINLAFRAAKMTSATEAATLISPNDALEQFGEYHPSNDLGFGIRAMRAGAGSDAFYVLRIDGDDVTSLNAGLKKLRSSDLYYTIALLTSDKEVAQTLRDEVIAMSDPAVMKWRKAYVGFNSPGTYIKWGALDSGAYRKATLINGILSIDEGDRQYGDFITDGIRAGDKISFNHLATDYTVDSIVSGVNGQSWQLRIVETVADVENASSFTVIKPDTAENTADFIKDLASTIGGTAGDGRVTLLWGDEIQSSMSGGGTLDNKYLAAWMAGLRCSLYPQQGTATYEVPIAASAPSMHTKFDPDLLQAMAASGVMVITQETSDTPVFVLDQVTTCTSGGLLKFQDNCRVIVDSFSYAIKDGQVGLKGKKNATRVTASSIANITLRTAIGYCQVPLDEHNVAGPRVLAFYDKDGNPNKVTVERNPNIVNRLSTYIQIDVPVPLNGIDNVIRASVGTTF